MPPSGRNAFFTGASTFSFLLFFALSTQTISSPAPIVGSVR